MELHRTDHEGAQIVTVAEARIDAAVAVQFKDAVRDIVGGGPHRVVLDLAQVTFLDSSGLGAVVGAKKQIAPSHQLELAAMTPAVAKVFKLTRMDKVFRLHEAVADAVNGAAGEAAHAC